MDTFDMLDYIFDIKKKADTNNAKDKKNKDEDDDWDICPYCGEYLEECTCKNCECKDYI